MKLSQTMSFSAAALLLSTLSAQACRVPYFLSYKDQAAPGTMYAVSGKPCGMSLRNSGMPIHGVRLLKGASNGRVTVRGNGLIYVSRAGFAGADSFTFQSYGTDNVKMPATTTVMMTVHVAAPEPGQQVRKK